MSILTVDEILDQRFTSPIDLSNVATVERLALIYICIVTEEDPEIAHAVTGVSTHTISVLRAMSKALDPPSHNGGNNSIFMHDMNVQVSAEESLLHHGSSTRRFVFSEGVRRVRKTGLLRQLHYIIPEIGSTLDTFPYCETHHITKGHMLFLLLCLYLISLQYELSVTSVELAEFIQPIGLVTKVAKIYKFLVSKNLVSPVVYSTVFWYFSQALPQLQYVADAESLLSIERVFTPFCSPNGPDRFANALYNSIADSIATLFISLTTDLSNSYADDSTDSIDFKRSLRVSLFATDCLISAISTFSSESAFSVMSHAKKCLSKRLCFSCSSTISPDNQTPINARLCDAHMEHCSFHFVCSVLSELSGVLSTYDSTAICDASYFFAEAAFLLAYSHEDATSTCHCRESVATSLLLEPVFSETLVRRYTNDTIASLNSMVQARSLAVYFWRKATEYSVFILGNCLSEISKNRGNIWRVLEHSIESSSSSSMQSTHMLIDTSQFPEARIDGSSVVIVYCASGECDDAVEPSTIFHVDYFECDVRPIREETGDYSCYVDVVAFMENSKPLPITTPADESMDVHLYILFPHPSLAGQCNSVCLLKNALQKLLITERMVSSDSRVLSVVCCGASDGVLASDDGDTTSYSMTAIADHSIAYMASRYDAIRNATGCAIAIHSAPNPSVVFSFLRSESSTTGNVVKIIIPADPDTGKPFALYNRGLRPSQYEAVLLSHISNCLLICGCPGSGKSTTLAIIIRSLLLCPGANSLWIPVIGPHTETLQIFQRTFVMSISITRSLLNIHPPSPCGSTQIILCAHSNKAADQLARTVLCLDGWNNFVQPMMLRLGSFSSDDVILRFTPRGYLIRLATELRVLQLLETAVIEGIEDASIISDGALCTAIREALQGEYSSEALSIIADSSRWTDYLISRASVIVGTIAGISKRSSKVANVPTRKILIIEEAARFCEFELANVLLINPVKLIMIGDSLQLPPLVKDPKLSRNSHFAWSAFHRLLFDTRCRIPVVVLDEQARSATEIANLYRFMYCDYLPPTHRLAGGIIDMPGARHNCLLDASILSALNGSRVCHVRAQDLHTLSSTCVAYVTEHVQSTHGNVEGIGHQHQEDVRCLVSDPIHAITRTSSGEVNLEEGKFALFLVHTLVLHYIAWVDNFIRSLNSCITEEDTRAYLLTRTTNNPMLHNSPGGVVRQDASGFYINWSPSISFAILSLYRDQASIIGAAPYYSCLKRQYSNVSVGVITNQFVSALVKNAVRDIRVSVQVDCCTVDEYQGLEADIVLLSLVSERASVFGNSLPRALVSVSRARSALVIIGNISAFDNDVWNKAKESPRMDLSHVGRYC